MAVPTPWSLDLPDVALRPVALADVELALLGVLPPGHVLGEAVSAPRASSASGGASGHGGGPLVRLRVPTSVGSTVLDAGGAVVRDEESTPLATLTEVAVDPADDTAEVLLSGVLTRRRNRESGEGAQYALSAADLAAPASGQRCLLVLARPVVDADAPALAALVGPTGDLVVVVPAAGADHDVPTSVLLQAAHDLTQASSLAGRVLLRTAPLAWRDADSDTTLVRLTAEALGAVRTLYLRPDRDDPTDAGAQWGQVRAALERGAEEPLTGVSDRAEAALRRWKPPRARRGLVVMFTGFSGSGKSTLARDMSARVLEQTTRTLSLLDGDVVRTMLSSGLGFDRASRILNVRRIGYVGAEIARHGAMAVCAPIAPYASTRAEVRAMVEQVGGDFVLVHVSTPLEECERRDLKGLYAKARAGLIPEFTGISDPYDVPLDADVSVDTSTMSRAAALAAVYDHLVSGGWLTKETA